MHTDQTNIKAFHTDLLQFSLLKSQKLNHFSFFLLENNNDITKNAFKQMDWIHCFRNIKIFSGVSKPNVWQPERSYKNRRDRRDAAT